MKLSLDQKDILQSLYSWANNPKGSHLTVGGYAGTGKTTLIGILNLVLKKKRPNIRIAYVSFTGKASQILKNKLEATGALTPKDFCGTIHSLMYTPKIDSDGKVSSWRKNKAVKYDLIIIDEASMVTEEIWRDLLDYKIPIIAVGDHGQLPPIGDNFNLMDSPQLRLENIHRQAAESPIIQLATMARETGEIPHKRFSNTVLKTSRQGVEAEEILTQYYGSPSLMGDSLILCGRNKTRVKLNQHVRGLLGYESDKPTIGETLICLKNNYDNKDGPVYNGMIGYLKTIRKTGSDWYHARIDFPLENRQYTGNISRHQFHQETFVDSVEGLHYSKIGDRFDFGYALTVHKAQGSQAQTVILFEERSQYWTDDDWRRWLYTAITRAGQNLYILA